MPKIFLAACSHLKTPIVNSNTKPHYILESFMDLRGGTKAKDDYVKWCLTADDFLLDSGAFAFMNKAKKVDNFSVQDINNYIKEYAEFINKYDIKNFFELDLDCMFPYEQIKRARRWLEKRTHKKCIPVWHTSRGVEDFHSMCKEYHYIAIGGITNEIKQKDWGILWDLCDIAHQYGCIVHGLGFTPVKILNEDNCPFDTCDGTTWQGVQRAYTYKLIDGKLYKEKDIEMANHTKNWKPVAEECYVSWTNFSRLKG